MNLAQTLVAQAIAKGVIVTTAESCTGGMVAAAITDVPGSSAMFERGFVTYANDAKSQMLSVKHETLGTYGAVSEEVAREMAIGAVRHANAQISVAVSGIAGPGGSEHKPEGRVCFASSTGDRTRSSTVEFGSLGRAAVRQAATDHALALLITELTEL